MLVLFKMKKGELSFQIIVSAIIAVIVLVVLIIIFHKQLATLLAPLTDAIKNAVGLSEDLGSIGK